MKRLIPALSLAFLLTGCGVLEEIDKQNQAEDKLRRTKNAQCIVSFEQAQIVTGTVFNSAYTNGAGNFVKGTATLLVTPDRDTNTLLRFDYREERQVVLPVWDDFDIGLNDMVLYHKPGTKITWKEGFRPYDVPVEHVNSYHQGRPFREVWPCARFPSQ